MKKHKKIFTLLFSIVAILILLTSFVVAGFGIMTTKGYGITEGRCLITATGSYMLIDENNSPIVMSNQSEKDLFADLSSGDEILVLHDGIQESYPAGTGAYYCIKLNDGKPEDIPTSLIENLTEMGWLKKDVKGTRVECVGENYKISLTIPDGWEYEQTLYKNDIILTNPEMLLENSEKQEVYDTIEFRPVGVEEGKIVFRFDDNFGVCGTGLESKTVYLGEYIGNMGTYDNSDKWSFIVLEENYVILNQSGSWWNEHKDKVMEILSTIEYE
ncbi:MAG: hypothetical protein IJZ16_03215 [Clostridia bacterium]|nr:hypothetical protein [Clostridia bacterium]